MERYKTVIVGAGPGGLRCAKTLAENNEDFILLEGKPDIENKICTGLWGLTEKTNYMNLPDKVFEKKFRRILCITSHRRVELKTKAPFIATLNRKRLSEWMHKEAKKTGANISFGSSVTNIGRDYAVSNGKKIGFKYLVGADGSYSFVRKSMDIGQDVGIGIQYWVEKEYDDLEVYFDYKKFGPWYGWIAPHKRITSIGTGGDPKSININRMKMNLEKWCIQNGHDISKARFESAPISNDYKGFRFGNRFLVGDAAGLASGFTVLLWLLARMSQRL